MEIRNEKMSFLTSDKPILTVMVQADNPERIETLMDRSLTDGAEAFGMQFCRMKGEYRNQDTYRRLFSYAKEKPVYVTNYRGANNVGKTDEQLAEELLELADCGATLCDVVGDFFDKQPDELAVEETAVRKQMDLIEALHKRGAEVLMSSHVLKYTPAERVLEMALEQQRRGADICKIVTGADTMEQQLENLKIVHMLKESLKAKFLFLSGGESRVLRRIGGELGCAMYLCVEEYDEFALPLQPLLCHVRAIRDHMEA